VINSNESEKEEVSEKDETSAGNCSAGIEGKKAENYSKRVENHKVLLERYEQRLKNLDPELITPEDGIALKEAFLHAKEIFEPEELVSWFIVTTEPFYRSVSWKVLLPFYEELLRIAEKELGPDSAGTAAALNGLAGIYRYKGDYEESLRLFSRALRIREMLVAERSETGDTLSELGTLYYLLERHEEARSSYIRALEIQGKFLSPENLGAVRTLNRMAFFYKGMEKPEIAEEFYTSALKLLEEFQEHEPEKRVVLVHKAGTLNNLGVLLSEMGKTEEAEEIYGQALKLQEKIYCT